MGYIEHLSIASVGFWFGAVAILTIFYLVQTALKPGLRSIPGPFLAKFTDAWRLQKVSRRDYEKTTIELHKTYGDVVRVGPNAISIADPATIESIYGLKANFPKSKFYNVFKQMNKGKAIESLFTTQNIPWHSTIKRPVSSAYSMTTVTDYEPHVDVILNRLVERLGTLYCSESDQLQECNVGEWIHFFSFDVIAEMTWSGPLGFLDKGEDVGNMIRRMDRDMDYFASVSQMPWIDGLIRKNPIARYLANKTSVSAKFGVDKIRERRSKSVLSPNEQADFLSKFLKAAEAKPEIVDDQAIVSYVLQNLVAGSDTTAISIRAVLYYLLKNPATYQRLREEIDQAGLPNGPVSWVNSQKLLYLNACVKEAFRMHPAVGLHLERVTPSVFELPSGHKVPAGTIVGINAWPIHRNPKVFGDRVEQFVPERWLQQRGEDIDSFEERTKRMKRADMTFGYGSRTCIGKNIGLMETYKAIPTLLKAFDMSLVDPKKDWELENSWFVRQGGIHVNLKKRPSKLD